MKFSDIKLMDIELDGQYLCAKQANCFSTSMGRDAKAKWMKGKKFFLVQLNAAERIMTFVRARAIKKICLMDVITGSLYDRKKKTCLSSDYLKILSYAEDKNKGKSILKIKSQHKGL